MKAFCDGVEAAQASNEGDRARRALLGVACPAAEAGDAPGGPGEALPRMRVPLFRGLAFELVDQRLDDGDLGRGEEAGGGERVAGLAPPLDELHDARGGDERGRGQAFQRVAIAQKAVLEVEALRFDGAEQLLHDPATAISSLARRTMGGGQAQRLRAMALPEAARVSRMPSRRQRVERTTWR